MKTVVAWIGDVDVDPHETARILLQNTNGTHSVVPGGELRYRELDPQGIHPNRRVEALTIRYLGPYVYCSAEKRPRLLIQVKRADRWRTVAIIREPSPAASAAASL